MCDIAIMFSDVISIVGAPGVSGGKLCHIIYSRGLSGCISDVNKSDVGKMHVQSKDRGVRTRPALSSGWQYV